jgi:serine/threonine protein phosphatase PrpC
MEKRYSVDPYLQIDPNTNQKKIISRRSSDLLILNIKEKKVLKYIENRTKSKSPFRVVPKLQSKGTITSNSINVNEFKEKSPETNKSFKEISFIQYQNESYRNYMEDRFSILINFPNNEEKALFAIFDGHGGSTISEFLCQNFISFFMKQYQKNEVKNYEKIFQKTFSSLNDEIKKIPNSYKMGSTATIILITKETDQILGSQKVIYCANIGDTNCELFSKSNCKRISYEHRCNDPVEENRIKKGNGSIINGRVGGIISVTRAFGDFQCKDFGLICEPYINKVNVNFNEKNFLILATDGIWDFVSEEDIYFITMNNTDSMVICRDVVDKAKVNGSTDNMTCIVIKL